MNLFPDLKISNDVSVTLHHHKVDSITGFLHTDFNMVNFIDEHLSKGINPHTNNIEYAGVPSISNYKKMYKKIKLHLFIITRISYFGLILIQKYICS